MVDDDTKATGLIFLLVMAGVFGATYYYVSNLPLIPFKQPEIYADPNMKASYENPIWWIIDKANFTYNIVVYVFNPNDKQIKLDIYWEAFPTEMTPYCTWSSDAPETISPLTIVMVKLHLAVGNNTMLGNSGWQGDVLTQIGGEVQ